MRADKFKKSAAIGTAALTSASLTAGTASARPHTVRNVIEASVTSTGLHADAASSQALTNSEGLAATRKVNTLSENRYSECEEISARVEVIKVVDGVPELEGQASFTLKAAPLRNAFRSGCRGATA